MNDSESMSLLPTIGASSIEDSIQYNPSPTFQDFKNCYFISPYISRENAGQFLCQIQFTYHTIYSVASSEFHLWINILETLIQEIVNLYAFQEWLNLIQNQESVRAIRSGDVYYNKFKNCHLI